MTVYQAIAEMRRLSKLGETFDFSFMSYHRSKKSSEGIIEVQCGKLRLRGSADKTENSEIIEPYINVLTNEPREFYHPALMTFKGQILTLS